jgi:hypothetical protein
VRTPYQCLEQLAAEVAPHVPDKNLIVHVEVEFDRQPFEVTFASTPYDRNRFYSLSLRTPFSVPSELVARVREVMSDYLMRTQPLLNEDLVFLRLSVTSEASFFVSESCKQRLGGTP